MSCFSVNTNIYRSFNCLKDMIPPARRMIPLRICVCMCVCVYVCVCVCVWYVCVCVCVFVCVTSDQEASGTSSTAADLSRKNTQGEGGKEGQGCTPGVVLHCNILDCIRTGGSLEEKDVRG